MTGLKYCARCLYPENHPLNITFDEEGICSGCRVHEEKDELDWRERGAMLKKFFEEYRSKNGRNHDCVIPVSGARDSWFIVHVVKNIYGMNPLLVSYNKQYNTLRGIRNLMYLRTIFNCDYVQKTVAPFKVKKVTKYTLERLGSMYWHCLAGQTVFPVQTAVRLKIPLIVWGAHQGNDQVGMFSHLDEVEMTRKYRKEHDLMGFEAEDLLGDGTLTEDDVAPYVYPHEKDLEMVGLRGIYLNNYVRWDTKAQHELMIEKFGYETADQCRTFDRYNDIDCHHYSGIHDEIKYLKHGYGKVTDHATREIRLKRLTREEGIELVKKFQYQAPEDLGLFTQWLGIDEAEYRRLIEAHRNPRIWRKNARGEWERIDSIENHIGDAGVEAARLSKKETCEFKLTGPRDPSKPEDRYWIVARGYVDEAPHHKYREGFKKHSIV